MAEIQKQFSDALKKAALNDQAKHYLLNDPILFKFLLKAAKRYVGGENLEQALDTRKRAETEGFLTSLEFMGENVQSLKEADEATQEFLNIIEDLKKHKKATRVSFDFSHLGLFLNRETGIKNFKKLARATEGTSVDLFISAEGLHQTDTILDTYLLHSKEFPHLGITLQAYLHRTLEDLPNVIQNSVGKVRIAKGAYSGDPAKFLPRGIELNRRYVDMVNQLFQAKRYCSIATHDQEVLQEILPQVKKYQVQPSHYEFEMLYGICSEHLHELKNMGHPCRQYIVYGKEWYLYVCNRIAENPENIFRVFVDILT